MRRISRHLLTAVAIVAGALSLLSLFWWASLVYGKIFAGYDKMLLDSLPLAVPQSQRLAYQAINYFVAIGGAIGWVALSAMCKLSSRRLNQLPKWMFAGLAIGSAAAVVLPGGGIFAYFPIILGGSLLLRCWLAAPDHSFEADGYAAAQLKR